MWFATGMDTSDWVAVGLGGVAVLGLGAAYWQAAEARAARREATAANRYSSPWRVQVGAKPKYVIVNDGPEDAVDVDIAVQGAYRSRGTGRRDTVAAGSAIEISVERAWAPGMNEPKVTITWSRPDGQRMNPWTSDLPRHP